MGTLHKYFETVNKDSDVKEKMSDLKTPVNNEILNKSIIDDEITLAIKNSIIKPHLMGELINVLKHSQCTVTHIHQT